MVTHRTIPTWKRWLAKRLGIRVETINSNSSWKAKFFGSIFGVGGYDSTNRTRKVADPLPEPDAGHGLPRVTSSAALPVQAIRARPDDR